MPQIISSVALYKFVMHAMRRMLDFIISRLFIFREGVQKLLHEANATEVTRDALANLPLETRPRLGCTQFGVWADISPAKRLWLGSCYQGVL